MKAVVQGVASASVEVEGRIVSEIGRGLLVLVGIHGSDSDAHADYISLILSVRLFPNETTGRRWEQNVMQRNYEVLLVSELTLYGFLNGNKPDFHVAMPPDKAKPFYESVVDRFRKSYRADAIKDCSLLLGSSLKTFLVNGCFGMRMRGGGAKQHLPSMPLQFLFAYLSFDFLGCSVHDHCLFIIIQKCITQQLDCCSRLFQFLGFCFLIISLFSHWNLGVFGAMMKVNLVNDGPATMQLESPQRAQMGQ